MWDDELARVAQKWSDQCADVDYKGDFKRQDPTLFHDPHPQRKVGQYFKILTPIRTDYFNGKIFLYSCTVEEKRIFWPYNKFGAKLVLL